MCDVRRRPSPDLQCVGRVAFDAEPAAARYALMGVDPVEVGRCKPLVAIGGWLSDGARSAARRAPALAPRRIRLRETAAVPASEGGWVLLGRCRA